MSVGTSKYRVTVDSGFEDVIVVHLENNQEIKFTRFSHGLYCFDTPNASPVEIPKYNITENEKLINLKAPLLDTHLCPLLSKIKNIYPMQN